MNEKEQPETAPLPLADNTLQESTENALQKVFYRDLSATLPTLLEQLHAKDRQIDQLNQTITSLIDKNNDLQKNILAHDGSYYHYEPIGNGGGNHYTGRAPHTEWWSGSARPIVLIVGLLIFLIFGLKAFDYFDNNNTKQSDALLDEYRSQRQEYAQMVGEYESKINALENEKLLKESQVKSLTYTIDTLSNAVSSLSLQLNKEGGKTETINTLTQQLSEKEKDISNLSHTLDSVRGAYHAQKILADKLEEKTDLLEQVNVMNQSANQQGKFDFNVNVLYLLILLLMAAVIFVIFDRRR